MFTLHNVVPWGRSFDEYRRMFCLTDADLRRRMLGCADGPASFNSEATRRGVRVISCDPAYAFGAHQVRARIAETAEEILEQTRRNADEFVWGDIASVEHLKRVRMAAMEAFLTDYESGRKEGRYVTAELPFLPFADNSFELALCSHFLFLYSEQLDRRFHEDSIRELCRVAEEVRIFPLLALGAIRSPHVDHATKDMRDLGFTVTIERVPYEFQRGGNEMMRIRRH